MYYKNRILYLGILSYKDMNAFRINCAFPHNIILYYTNIIRDVPTVKDKKK